MIIKDGTHPTGVFVGHRRTKRLYQKTHPVRTTKLTPEQIEERYPSEDTYCPICRGYHSAA